MNDATAPPAHAHDDIDERRRHVHDDAKGRYWRRGFIGGSRTEVLRIGARSAARRKRAPHRRPWSSRILHRLGAVSSHAGAGVVAACFVLACVVVGWVTSFPSWWEVVLYSVSSSITLIMVFAIQHTQARQQAAVQRKLDEVLRATSDANNQLIAVEEAPDEELEALADLNIEDRQRSTR